jgi:hypothetical protein
MTDYNAKGTWLYQDLKELLSSGAWVCDAVAKQTHNLYACRLLKH